MVGVSVTAHPSFAYFTIWGCWCTMNWISRSIQQTICPYPAIPYSRWRRRRKTKICPPTRFDKIHGMVFSRFNWFFSMWPSGHTTKCTRLSYFYLNSRDVLGSEKLLSQKYDHTIHQEYILEIYCGSMNRHNSANSRTLISQQNIQKTNAPTLAVYF